LLQVSVNHGNLEKKYLAESPAAEKYQAAQASCQVAWQNVAQQQFMSTCWQLIISNQNSGFY